MNILLKRLSESLKKTSLSLAKESFFIDKPWSMVGENGEKQKLIFLKDKRLILSKNGNVAEGKWDYFPGSQVLYIDNNYEKLLLKEHFIDENVLLLKKDGASDQIIAFTNENVIPDYDIAKYLFKKRIDADKVKVFRLIDNNLLLIKNGESVGNIESNNLKEVEIMSPNYEVKTIEDGIYFSSDKRYAFNVSNGRVTRVDKIQKYYTDSGDEVEIINGLGYDRGNQINKLVTKECNPIKVKRLVVQGGIVLYLEEGRIQDVRYLKNYTLKNNLEIVIEQSNFNSITRHDKIFIKESNEVLSDGKYKLKGKLFKKLLVINGEVI